MFQSTLSKKVTDATQMVPVTSSEVKDRVLKLHLSVEGTDVAATFTELASASTPFEMSGRELVCCELCFICFDSSRRWE